MVCTCCHECSTASKVNSVWCAGGCNELSTVLKVNPGCSEHCVVPRVNPGYNEGSVLPKLNLGCSERSAVPEVNLGCNEGSIVPRVNSVSTVWRQVMAFLMKENRWPLDKAFNYVKERRSCVRPNKGFMEQLQTYEGILNAR